MRKAKEVRRRLLAAGFVLALAIGVLGIGFSMARLTAYAAGQATVTSPNGAKIREEASTTSTMVGGAEKGKVLTVLSQVQGGDGYVWYQVQVNDSTTGYVRSDLVEVTGDVPAGGEGEGGDGEGAAPSVEMIPVNPVSATVSGDAAEIRDAASGAGQVLATVPADTAITISGYGMDADSYTWYQVSYNSEGSQVDGFMLADNCNLADELVPVGQEPAGNEGEPAPSQQERPHYEIVEKDGESLLVDNVKDPTQGYPIDKLFENVEKSEQAIKDNEQKVKIQKIIIIVLVFLLVAAVAGIAFLVFKIRDMMDSAYFNEVENETLRRKSASGGQNRQKAAMHTVGASDQPRTTGARPAGGTAQRTGASSARPAGTSAQRTGAPQGTRSEGAPMNRRPVSQGTRPAGSTQGTRPASSGMQNTRPAGSVQGTRPVGQGQRPGSTQSQRPAGASQPVRRADAPQGRAPQGARPGQTTQKAQPKNFMSDDDEFEFEFLNYDGEDE